MKSALRLTVFTLLLAVSSLSAATHYVSPGSTNPTPPYATWATAATTIQDAVDAAAADDRILVTDGVYATGGKAPKPGWPGSRVCVGEPVTLLSVNGPQFTVIDGGGYAQCANLTDGTRLTGFTLTNGWIPSDGGGVACASTNVFLTNCVIVGNQSDGGAGAARGTLYNCTLSGNWVDGYWTSTPWYPPVVTYVPGEGGGAYFCTLYNCTLTGNSAIPDVNPSYGGHGGGAVNSGLFNCIVYFNTALIGANHIENQGTPINYCCTTPLATNGVANITNAPLFVDYTNGNLRLQSGSPCINAGNNAYVTTTTDLDGNPRIVSGTVDIGAYEYQGTGSVISYAWLQQYGLPTDGSADYTDADHDGMNNWQEWVCGTAPTNPLSALRLLSATPRGTNATVTWQSVAGVNYILERSANLTVPFTHLTTNILGQAGTTSYADTNVTGAGPFFCRVGVKSP